MTLKVKISNFFFGIWESLKEKITGKETLYCQGPRLVYLETIGEEDETESGDKGIS